MAKRKINRKLCIIKLQGKAYYTLPINLNHIDIYPIWLVYFLLCFIFWNVYASMNTYLVFVFFVWVCICVCAFWMHGSCWHVRVAHIGARSTSLQPSIKTMCVKRNQRRWIYMSALEYILVLYRMVFVLVIIIYIGGNVNLL